MTKLFAAIVVATVIGCGGTNMVPPPPADLAQASGDGGTLAFGATCMMDGDCKSNVCFKGGMRSYCSLHCTMATAASDCPNPPTLGVCNLQGYCNAP
jgi:hypothetical protein